MLATHVMLRCVASGRADRPEEGPGDGYDDVAHEAHSLRGKSPPLPPLPLHCGSQYHSLARSGARGAPQVRPESACARDHQDAHQAGAGARKRPDPNPDPRRRPVASTPHAMCNTKHATCKTLQRSTLQRSTLLRATDNRQPMAVLRRRAKTRLRWLRNSMASTTRSATPRSSS